MKRSGFWGRSEHSFIHVSYVWDLEVYALPAYILISLLCILLSVTLAYGVVGLGLEPLA